MKLRKLKYKDAILMLEWMHDLSIINKLQTNFYEKTLEDCQIFIKTANTTSNNNLHLAIVDDADVYMGTVSLKHITENTAEFAIVLRQLAMGKGFSQFAIREIIRIGFKELKLKEIYWCVEPENQRAVRFYDKCGYKRVIDVFKAKNIQGYSQQQIKSYIWYHQINDESCEKG